jgi:hypothetical protein
MYQLYNLTQKVYRPCVSTEWTKTLTTIRVGTQLILIFRMEIFVLLTLKKN